MHLERLKKHVKRWSQLRKLSDWHEPCSSEEIKQLEQELNLLLPESLVELLLWIGHGSWYFDQDNCRINDISRNRQRAIKIMQVGNSADQ